MIDVYYLMRLCCYENEQNERFKMEICNNRVLQKDLQVKQNGGMWSADLLSESGLQEDKVNVEVELAGWSKFGHGLRHIHASDEEFNLLFST